MNTRGVVAFVIAVVIGVLGYFFTPEKVADFVRNLIGLRRYEIVVSPPQQEFLVGEKLRFLLRGVETQQVVWLFDDQKVVESSVQVEYVFTQDPAAPIGLLSSHRVDALFKVGDAYHDATTYVSINNVRYTAKVDLHASGLSVTADSKFAAGTKTGQGLTLVGAFLEKYSDGKFVEGTPLTVTDESGTTAQLVISTDEVTRALGYHQTNNLTDSPLPSDQKAWIAYDFSTSKPGKKVKFYQPILKIFWEDSPTNG